MMPAGLFQAALVTTAFAALVVGGILYRYAPPAQRRGLALLVAVEIPMCGLALWHVRPLWEGLLRAHLGPQALMWARLTSAPLTEELAKAWPLLFVSVAFRELGSPATVGMALGLGFGIGEIWTVAQLVAGLPAIQHLAWYQLSGFISERLGVCFAHGAFTSVLVAGLSARRPAAGLLGAMALHFIGNFPILPVNLYVAPAWRGTTLGLWTNFFFAMMLLVLARLHCGPIDWSRLPFGEADCPDCKAHYKRPLLGLNFGSVRYEPCPQCGRWHWL